MPLTLSNRSLSPNIKRRSPEGSGRAAQGSTATTRSVIAVGCTVASGVLVPPCELQEQGETSTATTVHRLWEG
jgi:hypothetical protein